MCQFPSCCVTRDKKLLADKDIHSHSEICEIYLISDNQAKYEYDLRNFTFIPDHEPTWVKNSHRDVAERHFEKHYGSPELLIKAVKGLNPEKFTQWNTLYTLLTVAESGSLPTCPCPCPYPRQSRHPRRYPRPCRCPYPCRCLSKRQHRDWTHAWKKKWIELYSDPKNRS